MSKEREIYVSIYVASQAIVNKENLSITEYLKYFKSPEIDQFFIQLLLIGVAKNRHIIFYTY